MQFVNENYGHPTHTSKNCDLFQIEEKQFFCVCMWVIEVESSLITTISRESAEIESNFLNSVNINLNVSSLQVRNIRIECRKCDYNFPYNQWYYIGKCW